MRLERQQPVKARKAGPNQHSFSLLFLSSCHAQLASQPFCQLKLWVRHEQHVWATFPKCEREHIRYALCTIPKPLTKKKKGEMQVRETNRYGETFGRNFSLSKCSPAMFWVLLGNLFVFPWQWWQLATQGIMRLVLRWKGRIWPVGRNCLGFCWKPQNDYN